MSPGTDGETGSLSIRSVLVSVSDLDRSVAFYQAVVKVDLLLREGSVAVLGRDVPGSSMLYLREAERHPVHPGQHAVGIRSLSCDVESPAELDRIAEVLVTFDGFRDRLQIHQTERCDVVRGYDPDRLPLIFVVEEGGSQMTVEEYRRAMATMYSVDV